MSKKTEQSNIITEEHLKTSNPLQFITLYKRNGKIIRKRIQTINEEPSVAEQQYKEDSDANFIMNKYKKTGIPPEFRQGGQFIDTTDLPDLSTALNFVTKAQQTFDQLPSNIRSRFGNSPVNMVDFIRDQKNRTEAIALGLIEAPIESLTKPHDTPPSAEPTPAPTPTPAPKT